MQSPDWDAVNGIEVRRIEDARAVVHRAESDAEYIIGQKKPGSLPLRFLYAPKDSSTLVVSFHGSLQRSKYQLPRFEWRKTLRLLDAAALMIADTTLDLDDSMPLSWFVGTEQCNLTADIADFITLMAAQGGYSNILLAGSSGGGFAAMAVSSRLPGTAAVCFSPQTRIGDYIPWVHKKFVSTAFPSFESIEGVEKSHPHRVNLRYLYGEGQISNYVRYVQNSRDHDHVEQHYKPFASSLGIEYTNGGMDASNRVRLLLEPLGQGHQPPPRGRFLGHLRAAHEEFFGSKLQQLEPEPS